MTEIHWPERIWLVRHGESAGNVARDAAELANHALIDIHTRDADTPLSDLGVVQSEALGRWFGSLPDDAGPNVVLCSPYVRAVQTARTLAEHARIDLKGIRFLCDERLREKEFGILDRLTAHGIRERHPELAEQRALVGKFYFRPPGGESWCDVLLRLRNVLDMITRDYRSDRIVIVAHQVIVNCFRYLLEHLNEEEILAIDAAADVPNCSVTAFGHAWQDGKEVMRLEVANFLAPLEATHTPVTREPDRPHGAK